MQDWPELDSFFARPGNGPAQTAAALARLAQLPAGMTALLVTHQVTITALTGIIPRSGAIVITTRGAQGLIVPTRLPPG